MQSNSRIQKNVAVSLEYHKLNKSLNHNEVKRVQIIITGRILLKVMDMSLKDVKSQYI